MVQSSASAGARAATGVSRAEAARAELERRLTGMTPGQALPPERDLARSIGVARMTLRRAVDSLVDEGRLVRRPGAGTFVAPRRTDQRLRATSFSQDMRDRGLVPGARTLSAEVSPADAATAEVLGLAPGAPVLHVRRLRTADDTPMAVEDLAVPAHLVPGLDGADLEGASFYALIADRFGLRVAGGTQTAEPCLVGAEDAASLGVEPGAPAFLFERTSRLADGQVVEFVRSVYPGDRYRIVVDIHPDDTVSGESP